MKNSKIQRTGEDVEDLVEKICTDMFFADFTVRSHEFFKPNGKIRESADILIPFRDTLLVFQVKSRLDLKHPTKRILKDWKRIERKIDKAVVQIKTVRRFIQSLKETTVLRTSRGLNTVFDPSCFKQTIGIVIFEIIGEEYLTEEERTTIYRGITHSRDIPTHVFIRQDFQTIAEWVDTVPDFVDYLNKRERLLNQDILSKWNREMDYLGAYLFMPKIIDDALAGECDHLTLDLWKFFQQDQVEMKRLKRKMEPSYIIDHIIERQHETIGYNQIVKKITSLNNSIHVGTQEMYEKVIQELASLTRSNRIELGRNLIEVRDKAKGKIKGWCRSLELKNLPSGKVFVLLAFEQPRVERLTSLLNYIDKIADKNEVLMVIGIATEAGSKPPASFDICMWERISNHC